MKKDYSYAYHERKNYLNELYDKKKKKYEKAIDLNSISNINYLMNLREIEHKAYYSTFKKQASFFNESLKKYDIQIIFFKPKTL